MSQELLEIMEAAIRAEVEAQKLYRRGEQAAATEEGRALFRQLASEEERHQQLLLRRYQALTGSAFTQW